MDRLWKGLHKWIFEKYEQFSNENCFRLGLKQPPSPHII